jgi:bifunctional DNase/RNase
VCDNGLRLHEIDSRTSDAVALSIRFHCPIFTTEDIMSQAGILFEDEEPSTESTDTHDDDLYSDFRNLNLAELEEELQKAVDAEDYEKASLIRDEIRKRK